MVPLGKKNRPNQLRIIAGQWRGRKLDFVSHDGLRPTTDRIRETLFNWLQPQIVGARVLDLCAGSGALGLEAASRGAADVVMLDDYLPTIEKIQEHCETLSANSINVIHQKAEQYLDDIENAPDSNAVPPFDVIFLDPPFASKLLQTLLPRVLSPKILSSSGTVYVESAKAQTIELPDGYDWHRHSIAGDVQFGLVKRIDR